MIDNIMYIIFEYLEKVRRKIKYTSYFWFLKIRYGKRIKIAKNVKFRRKIYINIAKDGYLEIGDNCFFNSFCSINCHNKIVIGKNNLFGENVKMYDHYHIFNDSNIKLTTTKHKNPIVIGEKNWFGSNCIILHNAKIGNNNVFQANLTINDVFSNDNIVKSGNKYDIQKIKYK